MYIDTSLICDYYPEEVDVMDPIFSHFGGVIAFYGEVTTVKCFEETGAIAAVLEEEGTGRVLVVDGGGITRRALLDAELVQLAEDNNWEGIVVNGAIRQVDDLEKANLGVLALASFPVGANAETLNSEINVPVNFAGVSIFPGDYFYADTTGFVLSEEELSLDFENLTLEEMAEDEKED